MAKYDVTYSCGHAATVQLYGTAAERERKIAWMERDGLCPECYREWQREENARKAKETLGDIILPELTGTEKQIAYANDKRNEYVLDFAGRIEHIYRLEHLEGEDAERAKQELDRKGVDYETAMATVYRRQPKATACLHETDAGKLIEILKEN